MRQINPINHKGSIQLKFSVNKKRYSFNPIPGADFANKQDLATVQAIATKINNDILAGCFDSSLEKYRLKSISSAASSLTRLSSNKESELSVLDLWDRWVNNLNLTARTKAGDYKYIRSRLVQFNPVLDDSSWLLGLKLAPSSFNRYRNYLKACYDWGIEQELVRSNIYSQIKVRAVPANNIVPFSKSEIQLILDGFDELFPVYSSFVRFLFATGVRTSEAIGLVWEHIDLDRRIITIKESTPIDKTGNGYKKVRKTTKTGSIRELHMSNSLYELLAPMKQSKSGLVFLTNSGKAIDICNFRNRYWKPVLDYKNIDYRYPYVCRHTFLSHLVESGMSLTKVAYIAGHTDMTCIIKNYGKLLEKPVLIDLI